VDEERAQVDAVARWAWDGSHGARRHPREANLSSLAKDGVPSDEVPGERPGQHGAVRVRLGRLSHPPPMAGGIVRRFAIVGVLPCYRSPGGFEAWLGSPLPHQSRPVYASGVAAKVRAHVSERTWYSTPP
jgi:hypothetical protein